MGRVRPQREYTFSKTGRIVKIEETKRGIRFTFNVLQTQVMLSVHCWDTEFWNDIYWAQRTQNLVEVDITIKDFKKHLTAIKEWTII